MSEFITNGELRMEAERLCDENERLETENAKLRLQIHWLKKGDVYAYEAGYHDGATNYELDHCPSCKNIADLQDALDENAKLRELVRELWEGYNDPRCEECHQKDTPTCADCPICAREASVIDRMRELGVEVDE